MHFTKMHGAGNDFIIINNIIEQIPKEKFAYLASILCKRRLSIGADGIMFVDNPTEGGDYRMHFFNADGTEGEMCGNGARCICRYGYENRLAGEFQRVETLSGIIEGQRLDKRNYRVRINRPTVFKKDFPLEYGDKKYDCSYVELGDPGLPHLLVQLDNFQEMQEENLLKIGKGLRNHKILPKGANVNFFRFDLNGHLYSKTFERGVEDFTLACGTGAGSLGFSLIKKGILKTEVAQVNMPGGIITVELEESSEEYENIVISGPTNIVSEGIILDEEIDFD